MKYIVTNFAYGTGPYLRTTELAIALNNQLERRGHERLSVIVPWVYGEKQKNSMHEEFGETIAKHPEELLLDAKLGGILKSVFYTGEKKYEDTLRVWVTTAQSVSMAAHKYLSKQFEVEAFTGEKFLINGKNIALEINRNPRIRYDVAPSYSTSFGYIAQILEEALKAGRDAIDIDPKLLKEGIVLADSIEGKQDLNAMSYPATFSWNSDYKPRYTGEILVPPITDLPKKNLELMEEGLYVTITGIEGLERLYGEARVFGLRLYSNDTKALEGAVKALPHVIANPAIKFQFARSGWGSVWLSMFVSTPIVVPKFDPTDNPEIYFNNRAIEKLGIGIVYRGQPLSEILIQSEAVRAAQARMREGILKRWGTLSGNEVCAKLIAEAIG